MRRVFTVFAFSCVLVTAAHAQVDHIGLYSDATASCRDLVPCPHPVETQVFIVHQRNDGAQASQFAVESSGGTFQVLGIDTPYTWIGTYADFSVAYGACVEGDIVIGTLNGFWFGDPPTNCSNSLTVMPAPTSPIPGEIAVANCESNLESASGGVFYFSRPDTICSGDLSFPCVCSPLPTQSTTWGAVKALYR